MSTTYGMGARNGRAAPGAAANVMLAGLFGIAMTGLGYVSWLWALR
jgi:hypothetical protein